MSKQGGRRKGAGRKKGTKASHTLEAIEARKLLVQRVTENWESIISVLIDSAKDGDVKVAEFLINQIAGKAKESVEVTETNNPMRDILLGIRASNVSLAQENLKQILY